MSEDQLYPPIYNESELNGLNIKKDISLIKFKLDTIKKDLKHYSKLSKRFNNINNIIKYTSFTVLVSTEVGAVILSLLSTGGLLTPVIIGVSFCLEMMISHLINDGIIKRKRDHYRDVSKKIESFLDKFYIFSVKANQDGKIDYEEMKEYNQLLVEYNTIQDTHKVEINKQDQHFLELIKRELKSK